MDSPSQPPQKADLPSSTTTDDKFFVGPKGQVIPWEACLLALELEAMGFLMSKGPDPDSLWVKHLTDSTMKISPEMGQKIRSQKHHLLQIVAL